jgi:hypothetical protein
VAHYVLTLAIGIVRRSAYAESWKPLPELEGKFQLTAPETLEWKESILESCSLLLSLQRAGEALDERRHQLTDLQDCRA